MDSADDDFYGCDDGSDDNSSGGVAEAGGINEIDYAAVSRLQKPYKILSADDIRRLIDSDISTVSDVLSVSRSVACSLLCRNNWILSSVYDQWFATDDDSNPEPAAKLARRESGQQQICNICYDKISPENKVSAPCRHPFCSDCWKTYVTTAINDGPSCLTLTCPDPGCKAAVGVEMVESLLTSADGKLDKYYKYLRQFYVDCSKEMKWCPAPGCEFAVEFDLGVDGGGGYDVICGCSHIFCWNCTAENHRPVGCETVANWVEKNSSEAENTNWILAYTKPCPKCGRAIEKNQGCNHMTCRASCTFQFCWLCNKSIFDHTSCHTYINDVNRVKRENAKMYLERYTHYFERWHSNEKSRKLAMADLRRWRDKHVARLAEVQGEAHSQMRFVMEAWEQIVECRRVLKWSYAYGYYMEAEGSEKKEFFDYLQGEAEAGLERLHHCAEKDMDRYLSCGWRDFKGFREKLANLTAVTKNYFENLVMALENNLSEVEISASTSSAGSDARKRSEIKMMFDTAPKIF
ncbi:hypothetical protein C2S51_034482 [Perilla frutescens var. frutescens]|nr:hypothetical protein C2S51_034482 [Perilla frutescens var. frutescens]